MYIIVRIIILCACLFICLLQNKCWHITVRQQNVVYLSITYVCFGIMNSCWLSWVSNVPVGIELMCVCVCELYTTWTAGSQLLLYIFIPYVNRKWIGLCRHRRTSYICFVCCIMTRRWNLQVWWREVHKELEEIEAAFFNANSLSASHASALQTERKQMRKCTVTKEMFFS